MPFYFKIYATNLIEAKVEVCFLAEKMPPKPKWKDCETKAFFKGEEKINQKGEVFIKVDTSKLKNINKNTPIYATMAKFTYQNGDKEEILYKHFANRLLLYPKATLATLAENKATIKVGQEVYSTKPFEIKKQRIEQNTMDITTYHIYHDGRIEKHIVKNSTSNKYKCVYHDEKGEIHEVGFLK